MTSVFEVVVIGAGLSGLLCARRLQDAGYQVIVLEKSRGLGGRVATRRINHSPVNHGLPFIEPQGECSRNLICQLEQQSCLNIWSGTASMMDAYGTIRPMAVSTRYESQTGLTAVAKFLGKGLEIYQQHRVQAIAPSSQALWQLHLDGSTDCYYAQAVVIAIPSPQALTLLQPLAVQGFPASTLSQIEQAQFSPCLAVIASESVSNGNRSTGNPSSSWDLLTLPYHPDLRLINRVKSWASNADRPIWMIHSSPDFALRHLDLPDLNQVGQLLVQQAQTIIAHQASEFRILHSHRWRYAICCRPISDRCLWSALPHPLVICGDWCGGQTLENALQSGWAASTRVNQLTQGRSLPVLIQL